MCGRYYVEIDDEELRDICEAVREKQQEEDNQLEIKLSGEMFPTDIVPVQTGLGEYRPMVWGLRGFGKGPLINARSETVLIKQAFQESIVKRRCLIPASGYYEWKSDGNKKRKYKIYLSGKPIYLAGCYRQEKGEPLPRFVILTREAVHGLEEIHERMPVIIPKSRVKDWLYDSPDAMDEALTGFNVCPA